MIALYKHAMSTRRLDGYITSEGEVSLPRAEVSRKEPPILLLRACPQDEPAKDRTGISTCEGEVSLPEQRASSRGDNAIEIRIILA